MKSPNRTSLALLLVIGVSAGCSGSRTAPPIGLRIYDPAGRVKGQVTSTDVVRSSVRTSREPGGTAGIFFALTRRGKQRIHRLTRALAHRGARLHRIQQFAFEVRGHVYARPRIDYRAFPDGIDGAPGIEIPGLTPGAARRIAAQLREGASR
jgi:hypothetical protein